MHRHHQVTGTKLGSSYVCPKASIKLSEVLQNYAYDEGTSIMCIKAYVLWLHVYVEKANLLTSEGCALVNFHVFTSRIRSMYLSLAAVYQEFITAVLCMLSVLPAKVCILHVLAWMHNACCL